MAFTGCCGGEVCSVLKHLQPGYNLICHVYNPAKSPLSMKIASASRCRSVPSAKRPVPTSSCWDMAYKTHLQDFPLLNAMVSVGSRSPQTSCEVAPLPVPIPATVVGSWISGTLLPSLHLVWRAQLCFASCLLPALAVLLFAFVFSVTSRCQQPCCFPWLPSSSSSVPAR